MYKMIIPNYNSLEPVIDDLTLSLHYNGLYKNYLTKLNKLLKEINYDFKYTPVNLAKNIEIIPIEYRNKILYNLGGYLNHSLYFYILTNTKTKIPIEFINLINKYFTSFNNFKKEFINKALFLKGSGYTFLVTDENNNLSILNMSNQDTPYYYGYTPILTIDIWEHSYYIKYNYNRKTYLNNIFNIIDFNKVYNLYLSIKKTVIK